MLEARLIIGTPKEERAHSSPNQLYTVLLKALRLSSAAEAGAVGVGA